MNRKIVGQNVTNACHNYGTIFYQQHCDLISKIIQSKNKLRIRFGFGFGFKKTFLFIWEVSVEVDFSDDGGFAKTRR